MDIYVCKCLRDSDGRRSPCNNDTTAGSVTAAQRLGVNFLTYMNIYHDSNHSGCQYGERQKLAEYAVVRPRCILGQVAVTTMMHAVGTFRLCDYHTFLMHVNR